MSKPSKKKQNKSANKHERVKRLLDMGVQFHRERNTSAAEDAYRRVIEVEPLNFRGLYLLGALHAENGNFKDAAEFMRLAVQINPKYAMAHNDLGVILQQMGALSEATESFKTALELNAEFAEAQNNLGTIYGARGDMKKSRECFQAAMDLNPYYFDAANNYIFALDLDEKSTVDSLIQFRKDWSKTHEEPLLSTHKPHTNKLTTNRKLRIGYVSADLRLHSASFCFGALIEHFDKEKFEVYCYNNYHDKKDNRAQFFESCATSWTDIYGWSDDEVAAKIRKDEIDILVDLSGYSAGSRLLTFARKPAPIQCTGWGYATSTGMKSMDYFFADSIVVPENEREKYVEEVVNLPCLVNHYCPEKRPSTVPTPALQSGVITFGSFNRLAKISDETYAVWAEILNRAPNSRMVIKINENDPTASKERIMGILANHGISGTRVFFGGRTGWSEHMRGFNYVDICLDCWPHTGGLTSVDSISQSVPVISLEWPTIVGRLTKSVLHTVNMDDWVVKTKEEYVELAVKWANDLQGLAKVREELHKRTANSILTDNIGYTRIVEQEYSKMWEKYVATKT